MLYIFGMRLRKDYFSGIDIVIIIAVIVTFIGIFESNSHGIITIFYVLARYGMN